MYPQHVLIFQHVPATCSLVFRFLEISHNFKNGSFDELGPYLGISIVKIQRVYKISI